MKLRIITVDTQLEREGCDYITLDIADDKKGGFSGCCGIKKGHARALMSLREGKVTAQKEGKVIFTATTSAGFATVKDNVVTVAVDSADVTEQ